MRLAVGHATTLCPSSRLVLSRLTLPSSSWSYHLHLDAADLVELAAFVVSPDATAQTLHRDRRQSGFVSCRRSGGLAVMPRTTMRSSKIWHL